MPIPLSHPIAVLPLRKTGLNFSGLVIGSMAPDFIYFFQNNAGGHFGHTLEGAFLFCLPVSLVIYLLFHFFLKSPLFSILAPIDQDNCRHLLRNERISLKYILILIVSILTGVLTHSVWDSFTHSYGWSVEHFSILKQYISLGAFQLPIYKILQYSGHLLCVPILIFYYLAVMRSDQTEPIIPCDAFKNRLPFILKLTAVQIGLLFLAVLFTLLNFSEFGIYKGVGKITVTLFNLNIFAIIFFSAISNLSYHLSHQSRLK